MKLFISPIFPHSYFVPLDAQDDYKWIGMNLAFHSLLTCHDCGSDLIHLPLSVSIPHPSFSCLQISISFQ